MFRFMAVSILAAALTPGVAPSTSNSTSGPWQVDNRHSDVQLVSNATTDFGKKVTRTPDGKLQVVGELVLTRVDRNAQIEPNEAYSGPTYGPPMIHRVVREAPFVLDAPAAAQKDGVTISGSTSVTRESFPLIAHTCVEATVRYAAEPGYDATVLKDEEMHAALVVNLPNYASAIVTTNEIVGSISSI